MWPAPGMLTERKHGDEWTFARARSVPGHDPDQHRHRPEIKNGEHRKSNAHRFRDLMRRARFAGRYSDELDASERIDRKRHCQKRGEEPLRKESSLRNVLRRRVTVHKEQGAQRHEGCDCDDLHHGKPEFEAAILAHIDQVDQQQAQRKTGDPDNPWNTREPPPHVDPGRDQFGADGNRDGGPVSAPGKKACPVVEVEVAVDAKRTGGWVSAGQFSERAGHREVDKSGQQVTENDGWPGEPDGAGGTEQQAGSNRSANRDHGDLPGAKFVTKSLLYVRVARLRHLERIPEKEPTSQSSKPE